MAKRSRTRSKGRRETATFVRMYSHLLNDVGFQALSGAAAKTLLYLASQYSGFNNGDLDITATNVGRRGFSLSPAMLLRGAKELESAGFIVKSRQGGKHRASLYALSWFAIDECGGKLDIPATPVPPNYWRKKSSPLVTQSAPPVKQSPNVEPVKRHECFTRNAVKPINPFELLHP